MAGGRPAKPTALKRLQGNPGCRPLNANEPQPEMDSGYCPRHLSRMARAEWRRVVPELREIGLLTVVDRAALEAYCECYADWRRAKDVLAKEGMTFTTPNGYVQQRPEVAIASNALKMMKAFMTEFGMTPSSRSKVKAPQLEEDDPFGDYMAQSRVTERLADTVVDE